MVNKLRSVMRYIVKNYPYPEDLTKTRITKLVFLIDWESVIERDKQITKIEWYFDHYGPYVSDVLDEADEDKRIRIVSTTSNFGTVKYIVTSKYDKEELTYDDLDNIDINIINTVINKTKDLNWNEFIDYVYSTAPVKNTKKYNSLDLLQIKNNLDDS